MRSRKDPFFKQQEVPLRFIAKSTEQDDEWEPVLGETFDVTAIVRANAAIVNPIQGVTEFDQVLTIFIDKVQLDKVSPKIGYQVVFKEYTYTVTKVDARGVLPSGYNCRLEAVRK